MAERHATRARRLQGTGNCRRNIFWPDSAEQGNRFARGATGADQTANAKKLLAQLMCRAVLREPCRSIDGRSAGVAQALNARRGATIEIDCCSNATDSELDRV